MSYSTLGYLSDSLKWVTQLCDTFQNPSNELLNSGIPFRFPQMSYSALWHLSDSIRWVTQLWDTSQISSNEIVSSVTLFQIHQMSYSSLGSLSDSLKWVTQLCDTFPNPLNELLNSGIPFKVQPAYSQIVFKLFAEHWGPGANWTQQLLTWCPFTSLPQLIYIIASPSSPSFHVPAGNGNIWAENG